MPHQFFELTHSNSHMPTRRVFDLLSVYAIRPWAIEFCPPPQKGLFQVSIVDSETFRENFGVDFKFFIFWGGLNCMKNLQRAKEFRFYLNILIMLNSQNNFFWKDVYVGKLWWIFLQNLTQFGSNCLFMVILALLVDLAHLTRFGSLGHVLSLGITEGEGLLTPVTSVYLSLNPRKFHPPPVYYRNLTQVKPHRGCIKRCWTAHMFDEISDLLFPRWNKFHPTQIPHKFAPGRPRMPGPWLDAPLRRNMWVPDCGAWILPCAWTVRIFSLGAHAAFL